MDARGVTLEELAKILRKRIMHDGVHNYIKIKYGENCSGGTYYHLKIHENAGKFLIICNVNKKDRGSFDMDVERNGGKIVAEQIIEDAINSILSIKKN